MVIAAMALVLEQSAPLADDAQTLYEILGVDEDVSSDALIKAYRQRALEEHPDKGGDAAHFDDLVKAFKVLSTEESRDAYDEDLAKSRERSRLVEGGRAYDAGVAATSGGKVSAKQVDAPMRQKTAPTPGSQRQGKMRTTEPGKLGHCANEWKGMLSATHYMKAITDDVTEAEKTERLFQQYAHLPPGKEMKREWLSGVRGQEKVDLKLLAKKKEAQARAKHAVWLNHGPSGSTVRKQLNKDAQKKRDVAAEAKAKAPVAAAEVAQEEVVQ